jgi:hypothetical protein
MSTLTIQCKLYEVAVHGGTKYEGHVYLKAGV